MICIAVSQNGKYLLSGSADGDTSVRLWNVATGEQLHCFDGHVDNVWDVQFSPDGQQFASCSLDGSVMLWRLPEGLRAGMGE